ncbi:MAG TPA: translation elongation factor Ts, partial [Woeseiaceae bacterium]
MTISASMVKELRERTGAGMMECKKALVEAGADIDAAVEILRTSGQAKADKKAGRIAAEGRIAIASKGSSAAIVEVNSETDFVAKDDNFVAFVDAVVERVLSGKAAEVTSLMAEELSAGKTIETARTELVAKVGENISVRRFSRVDAAKQLGSYAHGARIGVLVSLDGGDEELARDVAMHIAASNPACVDESGVPAETLERERR